MTQGNGITVVFKAKDGTTSTEKFVDAWGANPREDAAAFAARWDLEIVEVK